MKRKIKLVDKIQGKIIEGSIEIPNKDHLEAQIKYPALIQKPKKGKGSFKRKKKPSPKDLEE